MERRLRHSIHQFERAENLLASIRLIFVSSQITGTTEVLIEKSRFASSLLECSLLQIWMMTMQVLDK